MQHCNEHHLVKETHLLVAEMHDALLGSADPDGPEGLIQKVRRHDKALKILSKLAWLLVGGVITLAIAFIKGG